MPLCALAQMGPDGSDARRPVFLRGMWTAPATSGTAWGRLIVCAGLLWGTRRSRAPHVSLRRHSTLVVPLEYCGENDYPSLTVTALLRRVLAGRPDQLERDPAYDPARLSCPGHLRLLGARSGARRVGNYRTLVSELVGPGHDGW